MQETWVQPNWWQPTPVFLPGKSHGQRSLVGFSPRGLKRFGHDLATKQQRSVCTPIVTSQSIPLPLLPLVAISLFSMSVHCDFDFHSPNDAEIFSCVYWVFVYLHWRNIYLYLCPFLNWVFFLLLSCESSLYILCTNPLSDI